MNELLVVVENCFAEDEAFDLDLCSFLYVLKTMVKV